jgi:predicted  nucleic acid-binding Zn-ribbon protein
MAREAEEAKRAATEVRKQLEKANNRFEEAKFFKTDAENQISELEKEIKATKDRAMKSELQA